MSTFSKDDSHYVQRVSFSYILSQFLNYHEICAIFSTYQKFRKKDIRALFIRYSNLHPAALNLQSQLNKLNLF